jgi:hypothetical protein
MTIFSAFLMIILNQQNEVPFEFICENAPEKTIEYEIGFCELDTSYADFSYAMELKKWGVSYDYTKYKEGDVVRL